MSCRLGVAGLAGRKTRPREMTQEVQVRVAAEEARRGNAEQNEAS